VAVTVAAAPLIMSSDSVVRRRLSVPIRILATPSPRLGLEGRTLAQIMISKVNFRVDTQASIEDFRVRVERSESAAHYEAGYLGPATCSEKNGF
jgi:hypothetical protein